MIFSFKSTKISFMVGIEFGNLDLVNVLRVSQASIKPLTRLVEQSDGKATILVHPLYRGPLNKRFPITAQYKENVLGIIDEAINFRRPLVVLESVNYLNGLRRELIGRRGTLFTVPTLPDEPTPAIFGESALAYCLPFIEKFCWRQLVTTLKQIGVKQIEVGGRYMLLRLPDSKNDYKDMKRMRKWAKGKASAEAFVDAGYMPEACAGSTIFFLLERGFDVRLSTASSPTNTLEPSDLKGLVANKAGYSDTIY